MVIDCAIIIINLCPSLSHHSELMSHENITFNDNGTLSAIPHHPLEWREDLSGGRREDDIFYLPNIALLVSVIISCWGNYAGRMQKSEMRERASHPRTCRFWENPLI